MIGVDPLNLLSKAPRLLELALARAHVLLDVIDGVLDRVVDLLLRRRKTLAEGRIQAAAVFRLSILQRSLSGSYITSSNELFSLRDQLLTIEHGLLVLLTTTSSALSRLSGLSRLGSWPPCPSSTLSGLSASGSTLSSASRFASPAVPPGG